MTTQLPSKEDLKELIAQLEKDAANGWTADSFVLKIARALLAVYEQEPVGEVIEMRGGLVMDGTIHLDKSTYREIKGGNKMKRMPVGTKFYANPAPSIPAAVPDYYVVVTTANVWQTFCKTRAEADFIVSKPFHKGYYVLEVFTRRAAMLQAEPVNQPSGNAASVDVDASGEIKQSASNSGWVPVSERLPDNGGEHCELYLCWGTYSETEKPEVIPAWFYRHPKVWEPLADDCDPKQARITHWQQLPAAPKVTP